MKTTIINGANYSAIAGGQNNSIFNTTPNPNEHSFIGGGLNNVINGAFSAILGGRNNTIPTGMVDVGIFGSGITAVSNDTFHVSCLNAVNTPAFFGGAAPGTIMYKTLATLLPTDKVLVIQ